MGPDAVCVQDRFRPLLQLCPLPVFIFDGAITTLLACNRPTLAGAGNSSDRLLDTASIAALRSMQTAPGNRSAVHLTFRSAPSGLFDVSVESTADGPVCVLVHSAIGHVPAAEAAPEQPAAQLSQLEVRFRALADLVPVGIFLTNTDGRVMYTNDLWKQITGMTATHAMVQGCFATAHPDDRARVNLAWSRSLAASSPFDAEFRCVAGAKTIWVAAHAIAISGGPQGNAGFLGTFMDITLRREAEERIKTSEARYRSIFDNILDVYYETSLTGEILEVSPSIESLGGFKREDLLGRQMMGFYADIEARGRLVQALVERGSLHDYEIELQDKDGKRTACAITCKLERDDSGMPTKIIGSMRDINQRKMVEEMLRLERENLELIAKNADLPEILTSICRAVEAQAPGSHSSILLMDAEGKRLVTGAAPSLPEEYNKSISGIEIGPQVGSCGTAAATKSPVFTEDILVDPRWNDYRELARPFNLRACWSHPLLSPSGSVLGTFAMYYPKPATPTLDQITLIEAASRLAAVAIERARAEQERLSLESQMRQAQKLESLGVLAGGIAHDFNNLLTGILGYASLASNTLRDSRSPALKHVQEIEKVAQRAAGLTKQMLAYSGKGRFLIMPLDLSVSVEELAHLLSISISKKARLHYDFQRDIPLIEADPAQVQQVVMNLITNASEALGDQAGDITIVTGVVRATRDYLQDSLLDGELPEGEYVFVDVADTGCGMDQATLSRIFDPFFTTKFTGRGLGMSAVLGIMRGHRGTIKIHSASGQGTSVRLLFPALKRAAERIPEAPLITDVIHRDQWSGNGTVLIVDDEATIRGLAAAILAEDGYKVLTAIDGEQAMQIFQRHRDEIDVVLLDLTMPVKDGVETLHEIRASGSDVAVVISSGYSEQEVTKRVHDQFEAFAQKPYTRDALLACLKEVLAAR